MYDEVVTIQYPEGEHELRIGFAPPRLGDVVRRRGADWVVACVEPDGPGRIAVSVVHADDQPQLDALSR